MGPAGLLLGMAGELVAAAAAATAILAASQTKPDAALRPPAVLAALLLLSLLYVRCRRESGELDSVARVVAVTGAGSGIGRRVALKCLAEGDTVVALDVSEPGLSGLVIEAEALGEYMKHRGNGVDIGALHALVADVTDPASVAEAAAVVRKEGLALDAILNFAGVIRGGPLVEMDPGDLKLTMDVNVLGTHIATQALFPLLRRDGPGAGPKIVVVASEVSLGWMSAGFNAPYSMSKMAIEGFAAALRQELSLLDAPCPVVVLNPGAFETPMIENQRPGGANAYFEIAAGRKGGTLFADQLAKGQEVAQAYMTKHSKDPQILANLVHRVVHTPRPRDRYVVGASFEMRYVVPYLPQWVLDAAVRRVMLVGKST